MKFFKYQDCLAIVLPESIRKKAGVKEGDEYDFFEVEPGVFILASKQCIQQKISKGVYAELLSKISTSEKESELQGIKHLDSSKKKVLEERGYLIVSNESEAKEISKEFEKEIKNKEVRGTRGFDKKFYITTQEFYEKTAEKIKKALENGVPKEKKEISLSTGVNEEAVLAVLQMMKEDGEVIEKKGGIFAIVK